MQGVKLLYVCPKQLFLTKSCQQIYDEINRIIQERTYNLIQFLHANPLVKENLSNEIEVLE